MDYFEIDHLEDYGEVIVHNTKPLPKKATGSSQNHFWVLNSADIIIRQHEFCGEKFNLHLEGDNIILSHPIWSLAGTGKNLLDAERNLITESKIVFNHYMNIPEEDLSEDAIRMKEFLLRII